MNVVASAEMQGKLGCDVVIIEDSKALSIELAELLQEGGLTVRTALDGAAALIDCRLPDIDGMLLLERLGQVWWKILTARGASERYQ